MERRIPDIPEAPGVRERRRLIGPFGAGAAALLACSALAPLSSQPYLLLLLPAFLVLPATFHMPVALVALCAGALAWFGIPPQGPMPLQAMLAAAALVLLSAHARFGQRPSLANFPARFQSDSTLFAVRRWYAAGLFAAAVALSLRGVAISLSIPWLLFAAGMLWLLPAGATRPIRVRMVNLLGNAILLMIMTAATLALLEAGARVLLQHAHPFSKVYGIHPEYFPTLRPGGYGAFTLQVEEDYFKEVVFEISEQGLRDRIIPPKREGETRIVVIGDSFIFGTATTLDESIPKQLEQVLSERLPGSNITVVNAGLPGTGPWEQMHFLRECGLPLEPDIVLHGVFPANDIKDIHDR